MLELDSIKKLDPTGMHLVYQRWPDIATKSYQSQKQRPHFDGIDNIVFVGMGSSGTVSNVLSSILSNSDIHTYTVKGYQLPATVDKNTLVIAVSVSGNTDETLTVLRQAAQKKCQSVAFSKGEDKLESFCKNNKILHGRPEFYHSPRTSFASFLYYILDSLSSPLKIKKEDVLESIAALQTLQKEISTSNLDTKNHNQALELARWISGTPVIYHPWGLKAAAIRFKNSLNENVKMHAVAEDVLEACHNGIVAWERPSGFQPILIQGQDDYAKTKERWKILKEFFESKNIAYQEVHSVKGSILTKITCLIYLLDYTSLYKAFLSGIDPSPIGPIDFVKKKLI